jgi:hypothetical protein
LSLLQTLRPRQRKFSGNFCGGINSVSVEGNVSLGIY